MRPRRRWIWRLALGVIAIIGMGTWFLLRSHAFDPYLFLAGRSPTDVTVQGPGSWGPKEWRTYSWKEDWRQVSAQASRELPTLGLNKEPKSRYIPDSDLWMGAKTDGGLCGIGTDHSVLIVRGRAQPITAHSMTDGDLAWVTVVVSSDLEDNWVNIVRYTFFAYRY